MQKTLRIATRKSPLALWQAEHVAARLQAAHPGLQVELVKMVTRGDKILGRNSHIACEIDAGRCGDAVFEHRRDFPQ